MLQDVVRPVAAPAARTSSSRSRIVIQAWLASRGLILAVACVLAVVASKSHRHGEYRDVELFSNCRRRETLASKGLISLLPGVAGDLLAVRSVGVPVAIMGRFFHRLLCDRWRGALSVGRTVGGGRVAVCPDRGVHCGAVHRITVLCRGLLGVGAGAVWIAGAAASTAVACTLRVSGLF